MTILLMQYCHYRMGAGDLNHRQFAQQIDLYTGGLHVSPHICAHHSNELGYEQVNNGYITTTFYAHMLAHIHNQNLHTSVVSCM